MMMAFGTALVLPTPAAADTAIVVEADHLQDTGGGFQSLLLDSMLDDMGLDDMETTMLADVKANREVSVEIRLTVEGPPEEVAAVLPALREALAENAEVESEADGSLLATITSVTADSFETAGDLLEKVSAVASLFSFAAWAYASLTKRGEKKHAEDKARIEPIFSWPKEDEERAYAIETLVARPKEVPDSVRQAVEDKDDAEKVERPFEAEIKTAKGLAENLKTVAEILR
jgi:hypothetical protein